MGTIPPARHHLSHGRDGNHNPMEVMEKRVPKAPTSNNSTPSGNDIVLLPDFAEICSRVSPVVTNEIFIPSGVSVHQKLEKHVLDFDEGPSDQMFGWSSTVPKFPNFPDPTQEFKENWNPRNHVILQVDIWNKPYKVSVETPCRGLQQK